MRRLGVLFVLVVLIVGISIAQDTPIPDLSIEATSSSTWTASPNATWTSLPTDTPTLTLSPTGTEPTTLTDAPIVIESSTVLDTSPTTTLSLSPEFEITPSLTPTLVAEPPVTPIFFDSFDQIDSSSITWTFGTGWAYHTVAIEKMLRVYNSSSPITWNNNLIEDVVVEAQFVVDYGTAFVSVRKNGAEGYSVSLNQSGVLSLIRNNIIQQQAQITASTPNQWRTIRLSVLDDLVRVKVDGFPVLSYVDESPLPAGQVTFHGEFVPLAGDVTPYPPVNTMLVDNVVISLPTSDALPTSTAAATLTATPSLTATASLTPSLTAIDVTLEDEANAQIMSSFSTSCSTEGLAEKVLMTRGGIHSMNFEMQRVGDGNPDYGYIPVCFQDLTPFEGYNALGQTHVYKALSISPNGNHIAFMSNHDGNSDIALYITKANGSEPRRVTSTELSAYEIKNISWSPDGDQLAFVAQLGTAPIDTYLYVIDADGTDLTPIMPSTKISSAMWSPINDQIALTELSGAIGLVNPDGLGYTTVSIGNPDPTIPANTSLIPYAIFWSPDGSTLYFTARRPVPCYWNYYDPCSASQVYSVNAGGGTATNLSQYPSCYTCVQANLQDIDHWKDRSVRYETIITIGPDGRILFNTTDFSYIEGDEIGLWGRGEFVMSPDGSNRVKHSRSIYMFYDWGLLNQEPRPPTPVPTVAPTITPTPQHLEYFISTPERIYFVGADGTQNGIFVGSAVDTQRLIPVPTQIADGVGETTLEAVGQIDVGLPVAGVRTLAFECAVTSSPRDICLANLQVDGSVTNIRRYIATNDKYEHLGGLQDGGWNLVWLQTDTADIRDPNANGQIFTAVTYAIDAEILVPIDPGEDALLTDVMWGEDGWLYVSIESTVYNSISGIYRYNTQPDIWNGESSYLTDQYSLGALFGIADEDIVAGQISLNDYSIDQGVLYEAQVQYIASNQSQADLYKIDLLDSNYEPVIQQTADAIHRYATIFGRNRAVLVRDLEQDKSFVAYYHLDQWRPATLRLESMPDGLNMSIMSLGGEENGGFEELGFDQEAPEQVDNQSAVCLGELITGGNVRELPNDSSSIKASFSAGKIVSFSGRTDKGTYQGVEGVTWYQVAASEGESSAGGWIKFRDIIKFSLEYQSPCGDLTDTFSDPSAGCQGIVSTIDDTGAMKRKGPSADSEGDGSASEGQQMPLYGKLRNPKNEWWYLVTPADAEARWVWAALIQENGGCDQLTDLTPPPTPTPTKFPSSQECTSGSITNNPDPGFNIWYDWNAEAEDTVAGTFMKKATVHSGKARIRGVFVAWEDDTGRWLYLEPDASDPYLNADGSVGPTGWRQVSNMSCGDGVDWRALPRVMPVVPYDPNNPFIWLYDVPTATPGPSPTPTLAPDYSAVFPYPLLNGNRILLTNCGSGGSEVIMGRDLNPEGINGNFPAISSASGQIAIVDTTLDTVYMTATFTPEPSAQAPQPGTIVLERYRANAGLGNYVVYTILMKDLPPDIQEALRDFISLQRWSQIQNGSFPANVEDAGAIHIAFGHLMENSVSVTPKNSILMLTPVGASGDTGYAEGKHLDLVVYYTRNPDLHLLPEHLAYEITSPAGGTTFSNPTQFYNSYFFNFVTTQKGYYGPEEDAIQIDPLVIWPGLQNGSGCRDLVYFPDPNAQLTATPTLVPTPTSTIQP